MAGWIKAHRSLLENPVVCKDSAHFAVWMWLLMNATHTTRDVWFLGERRTLVPGQLITGRRKIGSALKINESKVQRILALFQREGQIQQITSNRGRLITIISWDQYQSREETCNVEMQEHDTASIGITVKTKDVFRDKERERKEEKEKTQERMGGREDRIEQTTRKGTNQAKEREDRKQWEEAPFLIPTLKEVRRFVEENGCKVNPEVFFRYYDSRDWFVGKEKMRSWQKQLLTWEARDKEKDTSPYSVTPYKHQRQAELYRYNQQRSNNINSIWVR
ncbi:MAG: hypothetical protein Q4D93_03100 [Porphyromonas sp.]|nr:hypothetical protein [Porphyromonas sp.]